MVLVNVKISVSGYKRITFQGYKVSQNEVFLSQSDSPQTVLRNVTSNLASNKSFQSSLKKTAPKAIFYRPSNKLWESNVFSLV